jgi:hypothetical protein
VSGKTPAPQSTKDKTSYRAPKEGSDKEERQPFTFRTRTSTTSTNPYQRVGRSTVSPFSRPSSRPGTGTSGTSSFHSFENQDEPEQPEPEPTDETTFHYELEPEPETETQLPIQEPEPEPINNMAPGGTATTAAMNVDHGPRKELSQETRTIRWKLTKGR